MVILSHSESDSNTIHELESHNDDYRQRKRNTGHEICVYVKNILHISECKKTQKRNSFWAAWNGHLILNCVINEWSESVCRYLQQIQGCRPHSCQVPPPPWEKHGLQAIDPFITWGLITTDGGFVWNRGDEFIVVGKTSAQVTQQAALKYLLQLLLRDSSITWQWGNPCDQIYICVCWH